MRVSWFAHLTLALSVSHAAAQELDEKVAKEITEEKVLADKKEHPDGWRVSLKLGATGAFNHSENVVGAIDGASVQLGLLGDFVADLIAGQHTWESSIQLKQNQSLTPQIESFVKSADELALETTYIYRLRAPDWLGFFVRGALTTQLFHGYDIRAESITLIRNLRDGTQKTRAVPAQTRFALTQPLEPLMLKESAGLVAKPLAADRISFRAKVGAGLQHVVVGNGFALSEDRGTELEFNQLDGSTEAGGLVDLDAHGTLAENISWSAHASFFYPFAGSDLEGLEAASTELGAKLSVKLATWLSLDYVFAAKYLPQIVDQWQVANGVTATIGYDLI
jgi:hypothetical protein